MKTPEEVVAEIKQITTESEGKITATVEAKLKELAEGNEAKMAEIMEIAKKQGEEITAIKANAKKEEKLKSVKSALREAIDEKFKGMGADSVKTALNDRKHAFAIMPDGSVLFGEKSAVDQTIEKYEANVKQFGYKAAATMTTSNVTSGIAVRRAPNVWDVAPKDQPFIRDFATVNPTTYAQIPVTSKINADGDAGWTAEGSVKPLRDFDMKVEEKSAKKVTAFATMSDEIIDDIDLFLSQVQMDLLEEVDLVEENGILFGTGNANDPEGVTTTASAFVLTSISTTDPNNFDAIRAAFAQIVSLKHTPTKCFVNPIDAANMDMSKTNGGVYVLPPFTTPDGRIIAGVQVIEKNQIPQGSVFIGDMRKIEIFDYKPLVVEMGYNGEDMRYNRISMRAEKRIIMFVKDNNQNAFVFDTFANIKSAITAVQA